MNRRILLAAGLLAPVLVGLLGCGTSGEKTVAVRGRITKGGAPFTAKEANGGKPLPPGDPGIRMKFVRTSTKGQEEFDAAVDGATGSFEALGVAGKGVPPGRYTITVYAGAFGMDAGKAMGGAAGGKGGGPPVAGGAPSIGGGEGMQGKPVHTQDLEVPDAGITDLVIDIKGK